MPLEIITSEPGISIVRDLIIGAAGSLVGALIFVWLTLGRDFLKTSFRHPYRLARTLYQGGITRFTLSRRDYVVRAGSGPLRDYLSTAKQSIDIVSISLNVTQAEGALIELFEQRIHENSVFRVRVSLLNPASLALPPIALALDMSPDKLQREIHDTLAQLVAMRERLPEYSRARISVLTHDTSPIGSAILLDANATSGRIQVETKLYRAPRLESFGFEVTAPSDFYRRNFIAWNNVFDDSHAYNGKPSEPNRPQNQTEFTERI